MARREVLAGEIAFPGCSSSAAGNKENLGATVSSASLGAMAARVAEKLEAPRMEVPTHWFEGELSESYPD
jgi:hypothetical protein